MVIFGFSFRRLWRVFPVFVCFIVCTQMNYFVPSVLWWLMIEVFVEKQQSIMKLLIIIFIWVQSVLPYYLSKMLLWGFFFSLKQGHIVEDPRTNSSYCVYNSDVATGYGVGAFLFLLSGESLLMGVTKCMCFGIPLAPGGNRAWSIIYFVLSWWVSCFSC